MELDKIIKSPKAKSKLTRVHINPIGETLYENYTAGRFTRPRDEFRTSGLLEDILIEEMKYESGNLPAVRWSAAAGCSCKCSPAFIVYGAQSKKYGFDLFCEYDPTSLQSKPEQLSDEFVEARTKTLYEILGLPLDSL